MRNECVPVLQAVAGRLRFLHSQIHDMSASKEVEFNNQFSIQAYWQ